jgi:hypothetical protein
MVSFFDLMALWFAIGLPIAIGLIVAKKFGLWLGIGAGLIAGVVCILIVIHGYRSRWKKIPQPRIKTKPTDDVKEG